MSPEQTLVEFISTSASFHGVKSQSLRSLEWDLLKVFASYLMVLIHFDQFARNQDTRQRCEFFRIVNVP
jgi:hypothetical protein